MRFVSEEKSSEWQSRLNRREESWDEIRSSLLKAFICNQRLPEPNVSNE